MITMKIILIRPQLYTCNNSPDMQKLSGIATLTRWRGFWLSALTPDIIYELPPTQTILVILLSILSCLIKLVFRCRFQRPNSIGSYFKVEWINKQLYNCWNQVWNAIFIFSCHIFPHIPPTPPPASGQIALEIYESKFQQFYWFFLKVVGRLDKSVYFLMKQVAWEH